MNKIAIIIVVIILLAVGGLYWKQWKYEMINNSPKCGGIAGLICPDGYKCSGYPKYPDAQGYCLKI